MSIAFGGIVAFLFRGMNLFVSLGLLILCSNQLTKDELGTFVLGLTVVGIVNAATGGLTAATGFQVSSRRRLPGLAFSSGGIIGAGLGVVAILVGLTVGAVFAGEAHRESVAVGFASSSGSLGWKTRSPASTPASGPASSERRSPAFDSCWRRTTRTCSRSRG